MYANVSSMLAAGFEGGGGGGAEFVGGGGGRAGGAGAGGRGASCVAGGVFSLLSSLFVSFHSTVVAQQGARARCAAVVEGNKSSAGSGVVEEEEDEEEEEEQAMKREQEAITISSYLSVLLGCLANDRTNAGLILGEFRAENLSTTSCCFVFISYPNSTLSILRLLLFHTSSSTLFRLLAWPLVRYTAARARRLPRPPQGFQYSYGSAERVCAVCHCYVEALLRQCFDP